MLQKSATVTQVATLACGVTIDVFRGTRRSCTAASGAAACADSVASKLFGGRSAAAMAVRMCGNSVASRVLRS